MSCLRELFINYPLFFSRYQTDVTDHDHPKFTATALASQSIVRSHPFKVHHSPFTSAHITANIAHPFLISQPIQSFNQQQYTNCFASQPHHQFAHYLNVCVQSEHPHQIRFLGEWLASAQHPQQCWQRLQQQLHASQSSAGPFHVWQCQVGDECHELRLYE